MTILVTGSTGRIGAQVINQLAKENVSLRALTRHPEKATFPENVKAIKGDLLDVDAVRTALDGVDTLFLLVSNTPDELTQAINTLGLARDAGVKGVVYLSVTRSGDYTDVPHFIAKHAVELMVEQLDMPVTTLRPSYFFQNDATLKDPLQNAGVYAAPIGNKGVSMIDIRDIADAASIELLRRHRSATPLPRKTYELSGPDVITGQFAAEIWADALQREVRYAGNDLDAFEKNMKARAPSWMAYDMRAMMRRYQIDGAVASESDVERLTDLLQRPLRNYRDFAHAMVRQWATATP